MTLLQNRAGSLPMAPDQHRVLVTGPYLDYGLKGAELVDEITRLNGAASSTRAIKGCDINGEDRSGFDAVIAAIPQTDVVVLALGTDGGKEHESLDRSVRVRVRVTVAGPVSRWTGLVLARSSTEPIPCCGQLQVTAQVMTHK